MQRNPYFDGSKVPRTVAYANSRRLMWQGCRSGVFRSFNVYCPFQWYPSRLFAYTCRTLNLCRGICRDSFWGSWETSSVDGYLMYSVFWYVDSRNWFIADSHHSEPWHLYYQGKSMLLQVIWQLTTSIQVSGQAVIFKRHSRLFCQDCSLFL